jgi:hypothetical protein
MMTSPMDFSSPTLRGSLAPYKLGSTALSRRLLLVSMLDVGNAYAHVSITFISSLPQPLHSQLIGAYQVSLKIVWEVWLAFTALALLAVFAEVEIPLKMTLESNCRLEGSFEQENKEVGHAIPLSSITTSGT